MSKTSRGRRAERRKDERTNRGGPKVPPTGPGVQMAIPEHIRELAERLKQDGSSR